MVGQRASPAAKQQQQHQQLHRFYIGNLPGHVTKEDIVRLISETNKAKAHGVLISVEKIGHTTMSSTTKGSRRNKTFALVATSQSNLMSHHLKFQGHALTIQPAGGFGSSSWVQPTTKIRRSPATADTTSPPTNRATTITTATSEEEEENSRRSALVFSVPEKDIAPKPTGVVCSPDDADDVASTSPAVTVATTTTTTTTANNSLDALLADYGEYDPNWQSMRIINNNDDNDNDNDADDDNPEPSLSLSSPPPPAPLQKIQHNEIRRNCLGLMGKAPIHVNISTFGRVHGLPSEYNSEAELVYDCDDYSDVLSPCPSYLEFLDGHALAVKRALVHRPLRTLAQQTISAEIMERLQHTIQLHGYGYANPYQMTIYIGSTNGRHRSIILAELTATAVRQRLRNYSDAAIDTDLCSVSVGCTHRDIQKKKLLPTHPRNAEKKQQQQQQQQYDDDNEDANEIKARRLPQRAGKW